MSLEPLFLDALATHIAYLETRADLNGSQHAAKKIARNIARGSA